MNAWSENAQMHKSCDEHWSAQHKLKRGQRIELGHAPRSSFDGTKMYGMLASSHRMGMCVMTSIGEMLPAIMHRLCAWGIEQTNEEKSDTNSSGQEKYASITAQARLQVERNYKHGIPLFVLPQRLDNLLHASSDGLVLGCCENGMQRKKNRPPSTKHKTQD
jgi:hypothetical protein